MYKNIYEDYKCLDITDEEIEALRLYISPKHIDINSILQLDPVVIKENQKAGWLIDLSYENINNKIDSISKIYSAMYKYTKKNNSEYGLDVYRGTTLKELDKLKSKNVSERFLSTSLDENEAMKFTEYNNGALINVKVLDDTPYIFLDEFLDETQVSEKEVLISPFCKVLNLNEYYSESNQVKKYSMGVKKQEFRKLDEDKREEIVQNINTTSLQELVDKIYNLETELDMLNARKTKADKEDLKYIVQDIENKQNEYYKTLKEFNDIKLSLNNLVQDKLFEVEKSIEKDINKESLEREDEKKLREEKRIELAKEELIKKSEDLLIELESCKQEYLSKTEITEDEKNLISELDVNIDEKKEDAAICDKFSKLEKNIEQIKDKLSNVGEENVDDIINDSFSTLQILSNILPEVSNMIKKEKNEYLNNVLDKISERADQIVKQKIYEKLYEKRDELEKYRPNILDKINGKANLTAQMLRNINIKISNVETLDINIPRSPDGIRVLISSLDNISDTNFANAQIAEAVSTNVPVLANEKMSNRKKAKLMYNMNNEAEMLSSSRKKYEHNSNSIATYTNDKVKTYLEEHLDAAINVTTIDGKYEIDNVQEIKNIQNHEHI